MSKTFISPKHDDFAILTTGEEDEFYGWVPAEEFVAKQDAELAALRSQLATVTAERNELFNVAVLSFDAMFEIGVGLAPEELTPHVRALDHALANDLNDDLWERINVVALKE